MCGIAGFLSNSPNFVTNELTLTKMLSRITHRGPDESGLFIDNNAAIGNVRLSIIDISNGQQPMTDSSQRYWIVFNGEIFNYIEIREELLQKGCRFKTHSDTEVLLELYVLYGKEAVSKLNGQFAFAIWDTREKELFIARDRVGIRPLFYAFKDQVFTFGSEIKSIFENPVLKPELSYQSLDQVLTFWTTLTPYTIFKDVYELPPGHFMTLKNNDIQIEKYWTLDFSDQLLKDQLNINDAVEKFHELFTDSVKIRLRADVPVAAYLSGGIDSSVTTSYIKKINPDILNTFSIGFADNEYDETVYQNEASKFFNTRHFSVKINNNDIAENYYDVVWHTEIPLIRTAPVPMYCLSKLVRDNNIKVVITGEGADEMLGGYNIFKESKIRRFWAGQPDSKIRPLLLKKLYPYLPQLQNANSQILKFFFGFRLNETGLPYYSHLLRWNNTTHIKKLLHQDVKQVIEKNNSFGLLNESLPGDIENWDFLAQAQWLESNIFMSGYLLSSQGDRMGMANSVEGRYPFLDHRLIEYMSTIPSDYKLNGLNEKYLLKKVAHNNIPESVLKRPKQAYRAPIAKVFVHEHAPDYVKEFLSEDHIRETGIFNSDSVNSLVKKIQSSDRATELENMSIAAILTTTILNHLFIKNDKPVLDLLKPNIIDNRK